jgi:hypothetical protein
MAARGHSGHTLVVEGAGLDPGVNMGFLKSSLATDFSRWKSISPNEDIDGLDVSHENSAGFASDGVLTRSAWPITLRHAATAVVVRNGSDMPASSRIDPPVAADLRRYTVMIAHARSALSRHASIWRFCAAVDEMKGPPDYAPRRSRKLHCAVAGNSRRNDG